MGDELARILILTLSKSEAFWLSVIGLALAAILAGYLSGSSAARVPQASVHPVLRDPSDASVHDTFAQDDVVVERPAIADQTKWAQPELSIVVGLCGYSSDDDERFMQTMLPIAFDIDPGAPQAARVAQQARELHDIVLVHLADAPTQAQLVRLRRKLGDFDGLASRASYRFVQALDGTGLIFFDERGDADASSFTNVDIPFAQRDVTIDNRTGLGYIRFMLERTVQRSQHQGRLVVLMRPQQRSLEALSALSAARTVQFLPLTQRS